MKKLARILGSLISVAVLLLVIGLVYSTVKGYTTWYFRVNGSVTVDGHDANGYLHANTKHTVLLVTRTDGSTPETYLVSLQNSKMIVDCGEWHPIRFFPAPIGDVNTLCLFTDPVSIRDAPRGSTLITSHRSVEFLTASGKKIRAEW